MLLFVENSFTASTFPQNVIYGFENSPLWSHLKSRLCQVAVADPIKIDGPHFDIFAENIAVINIAIRLFTYW